MRESSVRHMLKERWGKIAHVCPIENSAGTGLSDMNICYKGIDIWMELKLRQECPKKHDTPILKGYMRPQQKIWIMQRLEFEAKNIFLFARIEDEFFLYHISSMDALSAIENMSIDNLYNHSCWYGTLRMSNDEWEECLKVAISNIKAA